MLDILIQNGTILDGSGGAAFSADLGIQGGKIVALGAKLTLPAAKTIDAAGRCVTPGFLDIHRHADAAVLRPDFGTAELFQGLTTIINGNCGLSVAPCGAEQRTRLFDYMRPILGAVSPALPVDSMAAYLHQSTPLPLNCGMLVGAGTVRATVAGYDAQTLSDAQFSAIHRLLERSLAEGALGVSLGLGYAPESFYSTEELLRALAPLQNSGTVLAVHMRQEGAEVVAACREMIAVARALQTPVEISHLKCIGRSGWGKSVPEMLRLMAQARAEGLDFSCDVYPYPAGSTQLIHVLPPECHLGGTEALTERLGDPAECEKIKQRMLSGTDFENISLLVGFENIHCSSLPQHPEWEGKSIAEIAQLRGEDEFGCLFSLLREEHCNITMIDFIAAEEDIEAILREESSVLISDSTYPTEGTPHPRVYGAATRLLEHYTKERGVLSLPQAIHKLTRRSADRFSLTQKGRIEVGADADINIFAPENIHENASYENPRRTSSGMDYVLVGGEIVLENGKRTAAAPGKFLRR